MRGLLKREPIMLTNKITVAALIAFFAGMIVNPADCENFDVKNTFALNHVNIVDAVKGTILRDKSITVQDGKILSISNEMVYKPRKGVEVYELKDTYIIPALADMHVHGTAIPGWANLFLAYGVMTVRDMGSSSMRQMNNLKQSIASGAIDGPKIYASGRIIDGVPVSWPGACQPVSNAEEGRQAVLDHLRNKADFIKVYSRLKPDAYYGIASQCKKSEITFAGHVPGTMSIAEVSDAGQKSIEHLLGLYSGCVKNSATEYANNKNRVAAFCLQHLEEKIDKSTTEALCAKLKANGTYLCPTLVTLHSMAFGDQLAKEPPSKIASYVPDDLRAKWDWTKDKRTKNLSPSDWDKRRKIWERYKPFVKQVHRSGVKFLCGTDVTNPYVYPGEGVHEELARMVEFGFTPAEAIASATIVPAEYFGTASTTGTVEKNKLANFIVLQKNPLENIRNTESIAALVHNGKWFDRDAVEKLKTQGVQARRPASASDGVSEGE